MARIEQEDSVLVTSLDLEITETDLLDAFGRFGEIKISKILKDNAGRSRGLALLTFANQLDAQRAIEELNGAKLGKRKIFGKMTKINVNKSHKCGISGDFGHLERNCVGEVGESSIDNSTPLHSNTLNSGKAIIEGTPTDSTFDVCRSFNGTVALKSKKGGKVIVLDPAKLFAGVKDSQLLWRVFEKRPSTFLHVSTQLSRHFRSLVLNEFSFFLMDLEKIYLDNLSEAMLERLFKTLGNLQKKGLDVEWIKKRLEEMFEMLKIVPANARIQELQEKLKEAEKLVEEIKDEISQCNVAAELLRM